ncbi:hypothetical protein JTE90_014886 [Oedothorax gibbosus]|uniref:Lipase domain-containing protein n=1 Tax=Oedothorax gibbosus TaxID=931172 RepID=A0AAV6TX05_9ARAC|nr:hypothetical protein JTE90_014886 [Oedothorax gibbosus]
MVMDLRWLLLWVLLLFHVVVAKKKKEQQEDGPGPILAPTDPDLLLQRCYDRWGCFSIGEPFLSIYRPVNLFPLHPDLLDVQFLLKTRANPDHFATLRPSNETALALDPKREVKFIVHGYLEHGHQKWIQDMIREMLTKDAINVISVDWAVGAAPPYTQAVANARMVGVVLAHFIEMLRDVYSIPLRSMHLIGHSLGAHVAGYAGERLNRLGRITGLDPAEPYFQYTMEEVRLDPSDAHFVDVIHTDGGSFITGGLGMIQDCGHVDFYPNGGKRQPGCSNQNVVGAIEKEGDLLYGIRRFIGCNHIRAYEFFTESVNSDCPFFGFACDSYDSFSSGHCPYGCGGGGELCAPMGLRADGWARHKRKDPVKMFLHTANTEPFCRHHYIVNLRCSYSSEDRGGRSMHHHHPSTADKGRLFVRLTGTKAQTPVLEAKKEYVHLGSGVEFLVSAVELGRLLRVDVEWRSAASLLNPLTWRLFAPPRLRVGEVALTHLETGERVVFCGKDEPLVPHKIKTIFANQSCPPRHPEDKGPKKRHHAE